MLTLSDIENAVFRRAGRAGYNGEDVDNFLQQVRVSYEALIKNNLEQKEKIALLSSENDSLKKENTTLSTQVQQYRDEEDEIKHALISAQKLGDASIREARHKAEIILKDADIAGQSVVAEARGKIGRLRDGTGTVKAFGFRFPPSLLDMYRKHLVLIDALRLSVRREKKKNRRPPTRNLLKKKNRLSLKRNRKQNRRKNRRRPNRKPAPEKEETEYTDVSGFGAPEPRKETKDRRYDKLKFGDNYDITQDPDSPVDIFNRK